MSMSYAYRAKDRTGQNIKGILEAEDQQAAVARLREKGYIVTGLKARKSTALSFLNKEIGGGPSKKDLANFCRQFATMLQSGLPVMQCLNVLLKQSSKKKIKDAVRLIIQDLEHGKSLSEAMARHPNVFPNLMVSMIEAGEAGGILDDVFERLAKLFIRDYEMKQKVVSAMVYPIIVCIVAIIVVAIMLVFVMPKFNNMFNTMGAELPWTTNLLISLSNFVKANFLTIIISAAVLILLLLRFSKTDYGRKLRNILSLKTPFINILNKKIITSQFCRTLGTLLSCGVPLIQSLDILKKIIDNYIVTKGIENSQISVREGRTIIEPLSRMEIFSPMIIQMIAVGEEAGKLEHMLNKAAEIYDYEVEQSLTRLTTLVGPIVILILAVLVAFIIASIMMPISNLSQVIN